MKVSTQLKSSERRTKKIVKNKPLTVGATDYEKILAKIRAVQAQCNKIDVQIEKKLAPLRAAAGIDHLEQQKWNLESQLDDLNNEREHFEALVIDKLANGKKITEFLLRVVSKRFSVSYKNLVKSLLNRFNIADEFNALLDQFGNRKEQYVLLFKNQEVATRDIITK